MTEKFNKIIEINGNSLTDKFIASLNKTERENLIIPIFNAIRNIGWLYPDDINKVNKEWNKLLKHSPDISNNEAYNNSSLATYITQYFCPSFFHAKEHGQKSMIEIFNDDDLLKKVIWNRLGLSWYDDVPGSDGTFSISFKMVAFQGPRSMRLTVPLTNFKPAVAKLITLKYSSPHDLIYDYSAGFGGRLLGAASADRKYVGVDPLTSNELNNMISYLNLKDVSVFDDISENFRLRKNSVDFSYSSPPYEDQEEYSTDIRQAYNKGMDYFYNTYWPKTLKNVKHMLKPNKWFGLNVKDSYKQMISMAVDCFGEPKEIFQLKTTRAHLSKKPGTIGAEKPVKFEPVFMFINSK